MGYKVKMLVAKKGAGLALIKFVIYSIVFIVTTSVLTAISLSLCMVLSVFGGFDTLYAIIIGLTFFVSVIIAVLAINYFRGYRDTTLYIDGANNVNVVYKGKPYTFNILSEYNRRNLEIQHYTYSGTSGIRIYEAFGNKIIIKGKSDLLRTLLTIARQYGLKVTEIDDEPSDSD